ncbi:MAG: glycosyltransferase [Flavobacteriales bacterium]|nr:glycosyltransferase [Flavobacteriales bacterium]|tara:strand:- start:407 stop:1537 length:1131 start_codon:yes stop_codon:yes gene_type:complete
MRIAVNSRLLVPGKMDGIARFSLETFKLICANHPEHEFTFIYDRKAPEINFGPNTKNVSISPPARHPILWYIWFEHRLKNYLNKEKFDLFISPEGWVPPKLRMKSLAVIHDLNFFHHPEYLISSHRKFLQKYFPKYAKRADRIATVSEYSKRDIVKTLQVDEHKVDVVYNGVSGSFKLATESEIAEVRNKYTEGEEFFIFIGTIHPRKNLKHLLLAFEQFKDEQSAREKLVVVGNRKWWPQELEDTLQTLRHKDDVVFTSRLEDEEVAKLLSASIALSYLPFFEGFGIPILEAFKCGTAVITASNTSLPEVAGDAALFAKADDVAGIAAQMTKLHQDKGLRNALIEKGKVRLNNYSWDKTADLLWKSALKSISDES